MSLYRVHLVLLSVVISLHSSALSQPKNTQNASAVPTASNLKYPQSLFVDSQNGHIWVTDFDNHRVLRFDVSTLTNVESERRSTTPGEYFLAQNYPNPFNPTTTITFSVTKTAQTAVTVYNLLGQEVATLFNGVTTAHTLYSMSFDAKDLPSGIYIYSLRSSNGYEVKKMCVLK